MLTFGLVLRLRHRDGAPALPFVQEMSKEWWARKRDAAAPKVETNETKSGKVWTLVGEELNREETGLWTTELRAFEAEANAPEVLLTVTMGIQSGDAHIRPLRFWVRSPALLRDLNGPFEVCVGSEICRANPMIVDTRDKVEALVAELANPKRVLPIVAVSETSEEELLLPDLDAALARYLFGLSHVARLRVYQAQQLTNRLGKVMSCFHGGVRVYWPGWKQEDWPLTHTLFTRLKILGDTGGDLAVAERKLTGALMEMLSRATVGGFEYPSPMAAVLDEARAETLRAPGKDYEKECFNLLEELKRRDETILLLQKRLAERDAAAAAKAAEGAGEEEQSEWDYSVPQAIAAARIEFAPFVVVPDNVEVTGNVIGGTVYFFLKSLRDLCERVRKGDLGGNMGEVLKGILAKNGIAQGKFKAGDTAVYASIPGGTTKECRFRYHLKSGSPSDTESVYWADHGATNPERAYVIAHIGRHAG